MSPDQGGHTSMPVFGLTPPSYGKFTEFKTRDVVVLTSEATANKCQEAPHWAFLVDVTVENSKTAPPGTRLEPNPWQGPMVLSTIPVANANTIQPDGYMTNNLEVDNRGFVYATDRNGSGLDILELRGRAKQIGLGTDKDRHDGRDGDDD